MYLDLFTVYKNFQINPTEHNYSGVATSESNSLLELLITVSRTKHNALKLIMEILCLAYYTKLCQ